MTTTLTLQQVAKILQIGKSTAYRAAKNDSFPFPVLRIGGRFVIPAKPFLEALGLEELPNLDATSEVA